MKLSFKKLLLAGSLRLAALAIPATSSRAWWGPLGNNRGGGPWNNGGYIPLEQVS